MYFMVNEKKFKQLIEIATKNGFDINTLPHLLKTCLRFQFKIENLEIVSDIFHCSVSINDLVLNTNFFECLFKNWKVHKPMRMYNSPVDRIEVFF